MSGNPDVLPLASAIGCSARVCARLGESVPFYRRESTSLVAHAAQVVARWQRTDRDVARDAAYADDYFKNLQALVDASRLADAHRAAVQHTALRGRGIYRDAVTARRSLLAWWHNEFGARAHPPEYAVRHRFSSGTINAVVSDLRHLIAHAEAAGDVRLPAPLDGARRSLEVLDQANVLRRAVDDSEAAAELHMTLRSLLASDLRRVNRAARTALADHPDRAAFYRMPAQRTPRPRDPADDDPAPAGAADTRASA